MEPQPTVVLKDFGADWPLLPLNGEPPPLRSISGQPLHVYGRRLIRMKLDEVPVCFHFYVCVPYPAISVARLLLQGYKVSMESPDACMLKIPDGREARIARHGSLLFLCPQLDKFDEFSFAPLCNDFHAQFSAPAPPGLIAPTFNPVYYHADRWVLIGNTLIPLHPRARKTLFVPTGTKDRPLDIDTLASERVTEMTFSDGSKKTFTDDWRRSDDPCAKVDICWSHDLQTFFQTHRSPNFRQDIHFVRATPRVEGGQTSRRRTFFA